MTISAPTTPPVIPDIAPPVDGSNLNLNALTLHDPDGLVSAVNTAQPTGLADPAEDHSYSLGEHLLEGPVGVLTAAVDTTAQSLSLGRITPDAVQNLVDNVSPGFGQYYKDNKGALSLIGDIGTTLFLGGAAMKAVQEGSWAFRAMGLETAAEATAAGREVSPIAKLFAASTEDAGFLKQVYDRTVMGLENRNLSIASDPVRQQLVNQVWRQGLIDGTKKYLAAEGTTAIFENQSDNIYPSDQGWLSLLGWQTAGLGIGIGAEAIALRGAIRRSLLDPKALELAQGAIYADKGLPITTIPGERDGAILRDALAIGETKQWIQQNANGTEAITNGHKNLTALRTQLQTNLAGVISDGFSDIIAKGNKNDALTSTLTGAAEANPTSIMGIKAATQMPSSLDEIQSMMETLQKKKSVLDTTIKDMTDAETHPDAIAQFEAQKQKLDNLFFTRVTPDGDVFPINKDTRILYQDMGSNAPPIKFSNQFGAAAPQYSITNLQDPLTNRVTTLSINPETWNVTLPAGLQPTDLSRTEQSARFALAQKVVDNFKFNAEKGKIVLDENSDPLKLWMAAQVIQKDPQVNVNAFQLPRAALGNEVQWLQYQRLANSYDNIMVPMMDQFVKQGQPYLKLQPQAMDMKDISYALGFPNEYLGNMPPAFQFFNQLYSMQKVRKFADAVPNMDAFQFGMKNIMADIGKSTDDLLKDFRTTQVPWSGNQLSWQKGADGQFIPSALTLNSVVPYDLSKTAFDMHNIMRRGFIFKQFENAPPMIQDLTQQIKASVADPVARKVNTLIEGQQAGRQILTSGTMATRDIDTMTAARTINNLMMSVAPRIKEEMLRPYVSALRTAQTDNVVGQEIGAYVQARRLGLELTAEEAPTQNGQFQYRLATDQNGRLTPKNVQILQNTFPQEFDHGADSVFQFLPDLRYDKYTPLQISGDAHNISKMMADLTQPLYEQGNFFRKLFNQPELTYQPWYVPPENLSSKFVQYVVTPQLEGNGAHKYTITGDSLGEVNNKIAKLKAMGAITDNDAILSQENLKSYFNLQDEVFLGMRNFADPLKQTGTVKGTLATPLLQYGRSVLDDFNKTLDTLLMQNSRRTLATLYADELQYAKMADKLSSVTQNTKPGIAPPDSIYKTYINTLLGYAPRGIFQEDEHLFDGMLQHVYNVYNRFRPAATITGAQKNIYADLEKAMAGNSPYQDVADFAARTYKIKPPTTFSKLSHSLDSLTANLGIRILDAGNGLMALLGNLVSTPLVLNNFRRQPWDTDGTWAARTGAFGFDIRHNDVAYPDLAKIASKGLSFLFTKAGRDMIEEATKLQNIPYRIAQGTIDVHSPFEGNVQRNIRKTIDALSYFSDKGEQLSRVWAYSTGYQMAKHLLGDVAEINYHNMANLFANQAIANYHSADRPGVFQGALGRTLGVFQTFMSHYYNRLFSYIENRDYRSVALNYGLQAGLFGMGSVPGFNQFNGLYQYAYDGKKDIGDSLNDKFGNNMSSLILNGTLSNIPRLFGSDGIALYSRGDTNLTRVPAFISPENAPIFSLANNVGDLLGSIVDQFRTGGQFSTQQTLEMLGAHAINRPIARLAELAAGVSTDARGNLLNSDTRTVMSVASRLLGMKPLIEQNNAKALARIAQTEAYQEEIGNRTDRALRSLFRSDLTTGELDSRMSKIIGDHISNGGSPLGLGEYIKNAILAARMTSQERKFLELLKNPSRTNDTMRLVNAMQFAQN